jgi:hypothetical protein
VLLLNTSFSACIQLAFYVPAYIKTFNNRKLKPYKMVIIKTPFAVWYLFVFMKSVNKAILATRHQTLTKVTSLLSRATVCKNSPNG